MGSERAPEASPRRPRIRERAAGGPAAAVLAGAARAISAVADDGRTADVALSASSAELSAGLKPAVRAVTLGALRWYLQLEPLAVKLRGPRGLTTALRALLIAALHQLEYSRNPPEATVSSAVDATRLLRQARGAGLINALLRRYLRERDSLLSELLVDPAVASAHPRWLLAALQSAWPQEWPSILDADNVQPPLTLRVDLSRCSLAAYRAQLLVGGQHAEIVPGYPAALIVDRPVPVSQLPGFDAGIVSVQDAGAQLASTLLQVQPGERVLDACAAPGGKTGALLEAADGTLALTALDIDALRLQRVAENLARLGRRAQLVCADLTAAPHWWDARPFDRILLDAPCSSVGVIRRHPDIKLLRRAEDIPALAAQQQRILERCLGLLSSGGRLLYCTCSMLPAENDAVVEAALQAVPGARVLPMQALRGILPPQLRSTRQGMQLLPGNAALTDGFYYACLTVN